MSTQQTITLVVLAICSNLFGNINFAIIISKLNKADIRKSGSGNPGTMNMLRNHGVGLGALTLLLDVLKGMIPSLVGYYVFSNVVVGGFDISDIALYVCGLSAAMGHIFPISMKFKGGKGVATTLGVFIAASPIASLIIFALGVAYIFMFEFGSMGSMLFLAGMAIFQGLKYNAKYVIDGVLAPELRTYYLILSILIFIACLTTWLAHYVNIKNLIFGLEHKTQLKKLVKKLKKKKEKSL